MIGSPATFGGLGGGIGGLWGGGHFCAYARGKGEYDSETRSTPSHAVIHLLVHCKQTHTKSWHTETHTHTHTCTGAWCFPGGHGASGTELESLVSLFRSNYRNGTIFATTTPFFIFSHERGRGRKRAIEGERENKALTAYPNNGEWLSHPLSTVTVCSLSARHQEAAGEGRLLYYKRSHNHLT